MILLIDNFDSFVYNLADYVKQNNIAVKTVRNNEITIHMIEALNPLGIILSPGPKDPDHAGICLELVDKLKSKFPILGVCLGHQVIGQAMGAKIIRAIKPVHAKTSLITHTNSAVFANIESPTEVVRYHSLVVEDKPISDLIITSKTTEGEIMSFEHKNYPLFGVQFHPEALLSKCGMQIIKNFITICKKHNQ